MVQAGNAIDALQECEDLKKEGLDRFGWIVCWNIYYVFHLADMS